MSNNNVPVSEKRKESFKRRMERCLDKANDFLERINGCSTIIWAFLVGVASGTVAAPDVDGVTELLSRLFLESPRCILVLLSLLLLFLLHFGKCLLHRYTASSQHYQRLAKLYKDKIADFLQPFHHGRIGWGMMLTLQPCPDLRQGWRVKEVQIKYSTEEFIIPRELRNSYDAYLKDEFDQIYQDDNPRLMLVSNPIVFSDLPTLRLHVKRTKWSQCQFYKRHVFDNHTKRDQSIERILKSGDPIDVPNSLCLHLIVATSDGHLLLTQNSEKKLSDYPGAWAFSIGEQLDPGDLEGPEKEWAERWVKRALLQELGVPSNKYMPENARVLAVILEGDIVNAALVTVAILDCTRDELDVFMDNHRQDIEFDEWTFIRWDEIPGELLEPSRTYHSTTGIRMFYAGVFRFGPSTMHEQLLNIFAKV